VRPEGDVYNLDGSQPERCYQTLAGSQSEEDGGGAEEDRRGREFSGAEEVAKDPEAHAKCGGSGVRAPAKECGDDCACCEKYADGAGDPGAEQLRASLWCWIIASFGYRCVLAQNSLL
jgi:hypothetical protein